MKTAAWVVIGWLGVVLWTALGSRLAPGYVMPDAAMVVIVFVALYRQPVGAMVVAAVLGYLCGRQALAPVGLHELACVVVAIGAYIMSGQLVAGGPIFYAVAVAGATMAYHALLFLLLYLFRGVAAFPSWATASLVLSGALTGVLALVSYPVLRWVESRLSEEQRREGLQWR